MTPTSKQKNNAHATTAKQNETLKSRIHWKLNPEISNQSQARQTRDENNEENGNEIHSSLTSIINQGPVPSYENARVPFATDESNAMRGNGTQPSLSLLTPDICTELWYQPSDLAAFKGDIRNLLKYGIPKKDSDVSDLRRYCRDRISSKRRAVQFVLVAQKQRKGAEFLGMVSRRCSSWACHIALIQGYINFCQVNDALPVAAVMNSYGHNDFFFNDHCTKRKQTSLDRPLSSICGERRVCQRTRDESRHISTFEP
jgi:hypothetical protein